MSREIKFRAWDIDEDGGQMVYFDLHTDKNINYLARNIEPIMQYTGLKDKNGTEIYEGDILRLYGDHMATVRWEEDGLWILGFIADKFYHSDLDYIDTADMKSLKKEWGRAEVIGNIYENPDLLKGEPNE